LGAIVACNTCGSEDFCNFSAEIGIHVSGLKYIDVTPVFVFPELIACLKLRRGAVCHSTRGIAGAPETEGHWRWMKALPGNAAEG